VIVVTRYPGTGLFVSKRRYMAAQRALYPVPVPRAAVLTARALKRVKGGQA